MNTTTMTPALEFGCATSISPTLFASVALQAEPPVQVTSAAADATPLADSASNSNSTTARVSARRQSLLHKRQIQQEQQDEHDRVMAQQHAAAQHERRRKLKESHERRRKEKEAQLQLAGHTTGTKLLKARTGKDAGLVSAATTESYEKDPRKQEQLMSNLLEMLVANQDGQGAAEAKPRVNVGQAPPSPTPTSSTFSAIPSFIAEDPLSSDPDSSSDEDAFGRPKPPRPVRIDSHGLPRPRPAYYYDADFDPATGDPKKRGRRGGMKGIPVFEPTMEEFEGQGGFYGYVKRIEKYGLRSGVVKVIPPKEWSEQLPSTAEPLKDIRLREPIEQLMMGSQGLYRVTNVAKTRIWNPAQWKDMATKDKWQAPDFKAEAEREDRTDRKIPEVKRRVSTAPGKRAREGTDDEEDDGDDEEEEGDSEQDEPTVEGRTLRSKANVTANAATGATRGRRRGRGGYVKLGRGGSRVGAANRATRRSNHKDKDGAEDERDQPIQQATPPDTSNEHDVEMQDASTASKPASPSARVVPTRSRAAAAAAAATTASQPASPARPPNGTTSVPASVSNTPAANNPAATPKKRLTNLQRAEPTDEEWAAFVQHFEELPHGMKKEDYTVELMRDIERRYWRTLTFGEAPMYGADMAGSLFDDKTKAWNVAQLGDLLPRLAPADCKIPGVVTPYLYFGMWRATFAWHVEDADLYSINYIHFGAPKFWYSVPQEQADRFERVMEGFFPTDRAKCGQFLRHKAFLASPRVLANSGITLNRVAQMPGEFILTYPKGYHSGFNLGFNCAESINFATSRWLPLGKVAKSCYCIGDSVNINVDAWLTEAAKAEALEKGEPWPPVRAPPTPPAPPPPLRLPRPVSPPLVPTPPVKRKRPAQDKDKITAGSAGKKMAPAIAPMPRADGLELGGPQKKKQKLEMGVEGKKGSGMTGSAASATAPVVPPKPVEFPCALCPELSHDGLVKISDPNVKSKKVLKAHRICVMFTPATWIEEDPETKEELVRGYSGIEKARWKLKCQLCPETHGAKVQCTKGKCAKAVHVTCGLQEGSGYYLDATNVEAGRAVSLLSAVGNASPSKSKLAVGIVKSPKAAAAQTPGVAATAAAGTSADAGSSPDDESIKLTILCRTHNPDWQKQEAERKAEELKTRVLDLKPRQRVRVRTNQGLVEASFVENIPSKQAVALVFDGGKRFEAKWKTIVWEVPAIVEPTRTLPESKHVDYVYDGPKIKPSKKRSSYPAPPPQPYRYAVPAHPSQVGYYPTSPVPPPPSAYYPSQHPSAYAPPVHYAQPPHAATAPPPQGPSHPVSRNSDAALAYRSPHPGPYHYPQPPPPPSHSPYSAYYPTPPARGYPQYPPPPPHLSPQAWGPVPLPPLGPHATNGRSPPAVIPPPPPPMYHSPYAHPMPIGGSPPMQYAPPQPYYAHGPMPPQQPHHHTQHHYAEEGHGQGSGLAPMQSQRQHHQQMSRAPQQQQQQSYPVQCQQVMPPMRQQGPASPPMQQQQQQQLQRSSLSGYDGQSRSPTFANILDSTGGRHQMGSYSQPQRPMSPATHRF